MATSAQDAGGSSFACPACGTANVGEKTCRVCDVDLAPLHRFGGLPSAYFEEGKRKLGEGDVAVALSQLAAAATLEPRRADVQRGLGEAYRRCGMREAARACLERAEALEPAALETRQALTALAEDERRAREAVRPPRWRAAMLVALGLALGLVGLLWRRGGEGPAERPPPRAVDLSAIDRYLRSHRVLGPLRLTLEDRQGRIAVVGRAPSPLHLELAREVLFHLAGDRVDLSGIQVVTPEGPGETVPISSHVVAAGETLSTIARERYGNAHWWPQIRSANGARMADPHRLRVGQQIVLPPVTIQPR